MCSRRRGHDEFGGDVPCRFQPMLPLAALLVEAGILDRDTGRCGKCLYDDLVVVGEFLTAGLLGEVEVAEDLVADLDRDAEECVHGGMVCREADRGGVLGEVGQAEGFGAVDENTEYAVAAWQVADHHPGAVIDAFVDEFGELASVAGVGVADSERAVSGVDQVDGGVHDGTQCVVEIEARGDDEHRFDQAVDPVADIDDLRDPLLDLQ